MNDMGMYDGWTEHDVFVVPTFSGYNIRVTGRDRNDIKEYIAHVFNHALQQEIEAKVHDAGMPGMYWTYKLVTL